MGHLSGPQLTVLALWSYGIVLAKTCGMSTVVATLASQLDAKEPNLRQRLREWCWDKPDKHGRQRTEWAVQHSFGPLLRWILSLWPAHVRQLALAMDATSLKKRFVVLSISVVYRGCAIPIAWAVVREGQKGSWKEPWLGLFQALQGIVPPDWRVVVLADRGLYARWLYEAIQANGWHPFLRINRGSTYCPKGTTEFLPMKQLLPAPGHSWAGAVTCFANNSVEGTILAAWGPQYPEPWLILTDLAPEQANAAWYGLRSWIEDSFKDLKRGGWQWQNTRMSDPARAGRLWLALAVASLWVVNIGGAVDSHLPISTLEDLPPSHIARKTKYRVVQPRRLSCFSRGLTEILARLLRREPIRLGRFLPEAWPLKTYP